MANVQRYIDGTKNTVTVLVKSGVTVELGDLMFIDNASNLRNDGSSIANFFAYPVEYLRVSGASVELNKEVLKSYFVGVALDDKDGISGGSDENISIATSGKFVYDLKPAKTIKVGEFFSASGTTSASDLLNQKIMKTEDSDKVLGYFAESKTHAANAYVFIRTIYSNLI